ncbi:hypothetical protein ACI2L4_37485, partial [Streptomyces sparsogenes]|uniref:hypothetical protein n=1 Tax=Streptomyces sparsogenes TaxID=67365 RepID=UPI00384A6DB0
CTPRRAVRGVRRACTPRRAVRGVRRACTPRRVCAPRPAGRRVPVIEPVVPTLESAGPVRGH